MQKLLIEALGTALLCFTVGMTAARSDFAALAIGSTLMCAIYLGGHISGANYNPAVSFCLLIRGAISFCDFLLYVVAQLAGAVGGGVLAQTLLAQAGEPSSFGYPATPEGSALLPALVAEVTLTFALCHTVLHTATVAPAKDRSYYGLAIGFVVVSGAVSVGGVSGGAFNPAVGLLNPLSGGLLSLVNDPLAQIDMQALILYTAGPFGGALLAALIFRVITNPKDCGSARNNPEYGAVVVEFIGTFLLCFTVATAVASGSALAPISIGAILMTQVYAGAAVSGANYNPAVTLGLAVFTILKGSRDMPIPKLVGYVVAQLLGAAAAFFAADLVVDSPGFPAAAVPLLTAAAIEAVGTFFLVFTVLQVACSKNGGQDFVGLSIGFVVLSMAFTLGGLSGGAFNPAVGVLAVLSGGMPALVPAAVQYGGGPCAGALLAALLYRMTNADEFGYVLLGSAAAKPVHSPAKSTPPRRR